MYPTTRPHGRWRTMSIRSMMEKKVELPKKSAIAEHKGMAQSSPGASQLSLSSSRASESASDASSVSTESDETSSHASSTIKSSPREAARHMMGTIVGRIRRLSTLDPSTLTIVKRMPPSVDEKAAQTINKILYSDYQNICRFRREPTLSIQPSHPSLGNMIHFPTCDDSNMFDVLSDFPLPPTLRKWC
ncbi:hypothetical protein FRC02_001702 [Tulasnella sp. 418]|nr:hypothetical protein FRC02_001702 [Tulasnella sp. 418]